MKDLDPFLIRTGKAAETMLVQGGALNLTNSYLNNKHTRLVGKENCIAKG